MNVGSVATFSAPAPSQTRLRKAAQEFEGELLSCLLKPLEHAFSGISDSDSTLGSDEYGDMSIRALSDAISRSGGIGLSTMVMRQLAQTKVHGGQE